RNSARHLHVDWNCICPTFGSSRRHRWRISSLSNEGELPYLRAFLKYSPSNNASTQIAHLDPISIVLQIDIFNPRTPAMSRLGNKTRNKKILKKTLHSFSLGRHASRNLLRLIRAHRLTTSALYVLSPRLTYGTEINFCVARLLGRKVTHLNPANAPGFRSSVGGNFNRPASCRPDVMLMG